MDNFYSVSVFHSENGESLYTALIEQIGKQKDMLSIAVLSTVRLLSILPEPVSIAIISPMASLPLLLNHEDSLVKQIAQTRLQSNV